VVIAGIICILTTGTGVGSAVAVATADPFVMIDIGTLGGGYSIATDINDHGVIVGQFENAQGEFHAARWGRDGRISDLGALGGRSSRANRINAKGMVLGEIITADGLQQRAVRWDRQGKGMELGTLPGGTNGNPAAIGEDGTVVGYADTAPDANSAVFDHAVRWNELGTITDLGTSGFSSSASDINKFGIVVGATDDPGYASHAVRWERNGRTTYLDDLPGGSSSGASAINDDGTILGSSTDATGKTHAVQWDKRGRITDLGVFADSSNNGANLINDKGLIAGITTMGREFDQYHATVWTRQGRIIDLGTFPGGTRSETYGINDDGRVVGFADLPNGQLHAVLWLDPRATHR